MWAACCSPATVPLPATGAGPSARAGTSGSGAVTATGTPPARLATPSTRGARGGCTFWRCSALVRMMPKVVVAVVPGWAVGGGHSLHAVADLTLASAEHGLFKQTDTDVASFDGGFGSAYLARLIGQKRAREIFFLGRTYSAQEAFEMGMVNAVVPHAELESVALEWAREVNAKSPTAQRMVKFALNLVDDGLIGQQVFAGEGHPAGLHDRRGRRRPRRLP